MREDSLELAGSGTGDIVLPRNVYALLGSDDQPEQVNLYFSNVIPGPVDESLIEVECRYGKRYSRFWRLELGNQAIKRYQVDDGHFPLVLKIRDCRFNVIKQASTDIQIVPRTINTPCHVLFLGDSITRSALYVKHVQDTLPNVHSFGIRTYDDGLVNTEGRGGWSWKRYFRGGNRTGGESPFLFPEGVEGSKYWGNTAFWKQVVDVDPEGYDYKGFQKIARGWADERSPFLFDRNGYPVHPGVRDVVFEPTFGEQGRFLQWDGQSWLAMNPQPRWVFSFRDYMQRYQAAFIRDGELQPLHMVSILLGANDLQSPAELDEYIASMRTFIQSVKEYDANIQILLNLPIIGAGQDGFAGSARTSAHYRRMIQEGCKRILSEWDHDDAEQNGIYISPMLLGLDPVYGFDSHLEKANKYSDREVVLASNDVHPNQAGHCQMGDMLAGLIQHLRNRTELQGP